MDLSQESLEKVVADIQDIGEVITLKPTKVFFLGEPK
jgi:hypothetical protein